MFYHFFSRTDAEDVSKEQRASMGTDIAQTISASMAATTVHRSINCVSANVCRYIYFIDVL